MFWRRTQFSSLRPSYFCSCTIYSQSSPSICQLTPNNCLGTRRILQKLWGDWFPSSLNFFIKHFDDSSFPWQNEGDQAKVGNYLRNTQSLDFFLSLICLFFMSTDNCPACLGSLIGAVFIAPISRHVTRLRGYKTFLWFAFPSHLFWTSSSDEWLLFRTGYEDGSSWETDEVLSNSESAILE